MDLSTEIFKELWENGRTGGCLLPVHISCITCIVQQSTTKYLVLYTYTHRCIYDNIYRLSSTIMRGMPFLFLLSRTTFYVFSIFFRYPTFLFWQNFLVMVCFYWQPCCPLCSFLALPLPVLTFLQLQYI